MLSRMIAIVISTFLPTLGVILPVSTAYQVNALVVGSLTALLVAFSLADDRACFGAAVLGAWTAAMPFFFFGSLLEIVLNVMWGVAMFTFLIGPFSGEPVVTWTRALPVRTKTPEEPSTDRAAA
jgi:hypothetical protein